MIDIVNKIRNAFYRQWNQESADEMKRWADKLEAAENRIAELEKEVVELGAELFDLNLSRKQKQGDHP